MTLPSVLAGSDSRFSVLKLAAWFGLVTGLVEGAAFLLLQELGRWHWSMAELAVTREILWISPVFDCLLFLAIGLILQVLEWKFGAWPVRRFAFVLFTFLLCLDWLLSSGKIRHFPVLILAVGLAVTANRLWPKCGEATIRLGCKTLPTLAVVTLLLFVGVQASLWYQENKAVQRLPKDPNEPKPPNILVIVIDTLRADHVSAYGYSRPTTPTLDRLAREGVLFEKAFASSSWTLASHASLITGHYCFEHGAENEPYDGRFLTIGDELQKLGYRTAAFSANYVWFSRERGLGKGFIRFEDYFKTLQDMASRTLFGRKFKKFVLVPLGYDDWPARRRACQITEATLHWVDKYPGVPFFAFLNYFDVHDPYLPPRPYRMKFAKMKNPGGRINDYILRNTPRMTAEELQGEIDAYDGALLYADAAIGRLLSELDGRGQLKNTIVVVTSDHGEFFGEHGLFVHRNALYREVVHVPLVFCWPGKIPMGLRIAKPVSNTSLAVTLFELLGKNGAGHFPVPSLVPLWSGAAMGEWPLPLMELDQMPYETLKGQPAYDGRIKSLIAPRWQYIIHEKFGEELYDWGKDPKQQQNLAASPEGRAITADLRQKLLEMLHRKDIFGPKEPKN
jgi:arylsulfatase A-like enzyme